MCRVPATQHGEQVLLSAGPVVEIVGATDLDSSQLFANDVDSHRAHVLLQIQRVTLLGYASIEIRARRRRSAPTSEVPAGQSRDCKGHSELCQESGQEVKKIAKSAISRKWPLSSFSAPPRLE